MDDQLAVRQWTWFFATHGSSQTPGRKGFVSGHGTLVDVALRDLPTRASHRQFRRPFGRVNAAFYEWASASAVAEIIAPAITERVVAHLANQGSTRNLPVVDVGAGGGRIAARVAGVVWARSRGCRAVAR